MLVNADAVAIKDTAESTFFEKPVVPDLIISGLFVLLPVLPDVPYFERVTPSTKSTPSVFAGAVVNA